MEDNKESRDQHSEHSQTAQESGEESTPETGAKDPSSLPDGSGTNREGGGSDQGQEDGGNSFDAG